MNSTPLSFSFTPPPLPPGEVSTGIIITHTFFELWSLSYALYPSPPRFHWCQHSPLGKNCSTLLFSNFVEEKRESEKHGILACSRWR
jgi:hypothetical protein